MRARTDSKQASHSHPAATRPAEAKRLHTKAPPPFSDILCAVDGSPGSREAMHQAIALCGYGRTLHFAAVHEVGTGASVLPDLSEMEARNVLEESTSIARRVGIGSSISLLRGSSPRRLLLAAAAEHDLLVVGSHSGPRLGTRLGSTAAQIAHHTERSVLVARRTAAGEEFPQSVLLATDGSPGSWAAARIATGLAQARGAELRLVYVPDGAQPKRRREVLKQLAVIEKATGSSPALADSPGHVAERIGEAARATQSSLIVIARRGLAGVKALGSVSRRVVHRAPCSVLVVPARSAAG